MQTLGPDLGQGQYISIINLDPNSTDSKPKKKNPLTPTSGFKTGHCFSDMEYFP